ncbi:MULTISPECIES: tyrosine-type recombinase/integrase [Cyanophyceae]|uniref:tyrosine-type recombinase/integrase n=1 Tax=Cyanophyceae TaxID=3028117 RepID=UPI0002A67530|nr:MULTISPECIES: tyrosine-type recombinase/integrase [Cyanophyceae]AFZ33574.1 integrase family protein [Gloeocapsa sp. PCC 7428]PPS42077.1 integrase [Chroococcidiopsis sp. TS-821]
MTTVNLFGKVIRVPSPPQKTPFIERREREFLYLEEVDALIAATEATRNPIRNQALVLLLFCQALQPVELCWLLWRDLNFAENTLKVARNRATLQRYQTQVVVNLQPLCAAEINILQQLQERRTTEWLFVSERRKRLSARSLHHQIQQAGEIAQLPFPVHPYMLRRTGLYYRAALLLASTSLSLRQCCLLWNWDRANVPFSAKEKQEYLAISSKQKSAFLIALERMKAFTGIKLDENVIDYLLGAFLLFPRLEMIHHNYWLAPVQWH